MNGQSKPGRAARAFTYLVTGLTKVIGLASATDQLLFTSSPRALPLIVSAFMMAGAQFSEGLILSILDRVFLDHRDADEHS